MLKMAVVPKTGLASLILVKVKCASNTENPYCLFWQFIMQEYYLMTTISDFLAPDHKRCDNLFAIAEAAVANGDWDSIEACFFVFRNAMLHHFAMEEEVMFPAFEERTGMRQGPTAVMRTEHLQMNDLFKQLSEGIARKDADAYLGDADTLLIIMQQHNVKEEQMLYQMADQALVNNLDELLERMRAIH